MFAKLKIISKIIFVIEEYCVKIKFPIIVWNEQYVSNYYINVHRMYSLHK